MSHVSVPRSFHWPANHDKPVFPSLETLIVSLPLGSGTIAMLADIRKSHALTELSLLDGTNASEHGPDRNLHQLCNEISRHRKNLRRVELHFFDEPAPGFAHFMPILECGKLECLKIFPNGAITVQDSHILLLATALPLLKIMFLTPLEPYLQRHQSTTLTLLSMVHLLSKCPAISSLHILLDARSHVPDSTTVTAARIPPRKSLELTMIYSPITTSKHEEVVSFLRSLGVEETIKIITSTVASAAAKRVGYAQRWDGIQTSLLQRVKPPKAPGSKSKRNQRFLAAISADD